MKKTTIAAVLAGLFAAALSTQAPASPKRELRGVWVSTHLSLDWPNRLHTPAQQRAALLGILDHNQQTGMNAVFLQVRSQSDALYPSTLEPWSYYLTNQQGNAPSPAWDPLQFAIDESRQRGLEFHAWVNPFRAIANVASAGNPAQYAPGHVSRAHPEWMLTVGAVQIINPGIAEARRYVADVVLDIVQRYDIDGMHFDDYFYPTGTINDEAAYLADPRGFPNTSAGRADWRRDNINLVIAEVGERIRQAKPWVKFGVSPSGIYRSSTDPAVGSPTSAGASQHYLHMFADSRKWLQSGWVDYLIPQVYWYLGQPGSDYQLLVPWWNQNSFDRHMYIGLADYKMNTAGWTSPMQIADQITLNRAQTNVRGQVHFRHAFLAANPLGYRTHLKGQVYARPALLPAMQWKDGGSPAAPEGLNAAPGANGTVALNWRWQGGTGEFDKARRFAVYRSSTRTIDTEDAANLLGVTPAGGLSYTDASAGTGYYFYAVTALNRLHHESGVSAVASNDIQPPVVRTRNLERTLTGGNVSIAAHEVDNGSSDNWGIESLTLDRNSFGCGDIGPQQVVLTVTDRAGNVSSAPASVQVNGAIPQPHVAATPTTLTLGYGAQSAALQATDAAGGSVSSFAWQTTPGLTPGDNGTAVFNPTAAGSYTLQLAATNQYACQATASVTIKVIDARCGDGKVQVCLPTGSVSHPQQDVCVAPQAVPALVRKGAALGACTPAG